MLSKFLFKTRFVISSGPGALSGAIFPTAHSICFFVIVEVNGVGSGYVCVAVMSEVSAGGREDIAGRRTSLN